MSITQFKTNIDFPISVSQGDSFECELTVDAVLTNYKCRATFYDNEDTEVRLATANVTGGADTEVLITSGASSSVIKVLMTVGLTASFKEKSFMEVEIEDANGKIYTIISQFKFKMNNAKTTWTDA